PTRYGKARDCSPARCNRCGSRAFFSGSRAASSCRSSWPRASFPGPSSPESRRSSCWRRPASLPSVTCSSSPPSRRACRGDGNEYDDDHVAQEGGGWTMNLLRRFDGPLTRELVRTPGKFGLGQVPERLAPDTVTTLVCGYCSTGCGLRAHLRKGEVVNLSADPAYPVNLGMACPKGWEALAPARSPDRAVTPRLRDKATGAVRPAEWDE